MKILVFNPGSSSLKYSLFDKESLALLASGKWERWDSAHAERELQELSQSELLKGTNIQVVGCRVVHGGDTLVKPTVVDSNTLETIRSLSHLAPLHNSVAADLIESCQKIFLGVPIIAVFDTAFHQTLPPVASTYALPLDLRRSHNLRRFGFHGIAHQHVSERLLDCLKRPSSSTRLITCHLGNGASICALRNGKSIDTSMGLTPMEGLIMGTRSGDIDPGLILHLIQNLGMSPLEVDSLLNHQSGLLGLSETSGDVRDLEQAALQGSEVAEFALDAFAYRVSKYVGAYITTLEGLDAIAFSGGIGENSASMRTRICRRLGCFRLALNDEANAKASGQMAACISSAESNVSAWVIHANEELQIAREIRSSLPSS